MPSGPYLLPVRHRGYGTAPLCAMLASFLAAASAAPAQQRGSAIAGIVVHARTRAPIPGATALLVGTQATGTTDSAGKFFLTAPDSGTYALQVQAVGYAPRTDTVRVGGAGTTEVTVEMDTPLLAPVVVASARNPVVGHRFDEFERRRRSGRGFYLTREEISRKNASTVADLLRTVRGMTEDCTGGRCVVRSVRSMPGCQPQYFIDGRKAGSFGPSTPLRDIYAIELYRGPSETPAEFIDGNAACGVIVIWTKAAP